MSILAAIAAAAIVAFSLIVTDAKSADGNWLAMPEASQSASHLRFDGAALPPMAYTTFCQNFSDECRTRRLFRGGPVALTQARWTDLKDVNKHVNGAIIAESDESDHSADSWLIDPERGDCSDYAVSKRHRLLQAGWPARTLLLAEVVTVWGKHHLVLVVRTTSGDLVLDNLTAVIRPWSRAPYRWVRTQSPESARYWQTVAKRGV
jgi:predicted transglutaminase-like cysteine proteinase